MGVEGDNCTFSCDPGYMLQRNVTSGTCENTGSWSGGQPFCIPLNCTNNTLPVPANATVLQLPSCDLTYQSQCTVSCNEGFTGPNVTYLCNITNVTHDPTIVHWIAINNTTMNHTCSRGLLPYTSDSYFSTIPHILKSNKVLLLIDILPCSSSYLQ